MSPYYEERLERDLNQIRESVAEVAEWVQEALEKALHALFQLNRPLANETILGDMPINRAIRQIDRQCHYFIARHLPSAGHLRFISSVMRLNIELERIGDYAVTIAREAKILARPLDDDVQQQVQLMAEETRAMLHQAVAAFNERDPDLAKATMGRAYQMDHYSQELFDLLVQKGAENARSTQDLFGTLVMVNRLERVSDQAKNICEETIFAVTGETKPPKVYRILFLEKSDACRSQMAVAIARKAYPNSGTYRSAGLHPADQLDPACAHFMMENGYALSDASPKKFEEIPEDWRANHVVVSLEGPVEQYLGEIPFHTVALEWEVPGLPSTDSPEEAKQAAFEEVYRVLAAGISELMEMLQGEEAS